MIGARQTPVRTAIADSGLSPLFALGEQLGRPIFTGSWLAPFVVFVPGNLTKCFGYCYTGSFTCEVFIDGVLSFTVTGTDYDTPVDLEVGEDGALSAPSLITFNITAASSDVSNILITVV